MQAQTSVAPSTDRERYQVDPTRRWPTRHRGVSYRLNAKLDRMYYVYDRGTYVLGGQSLEDALVKQGELKKAKATGAKPVKRSNLTFGEVCEEWFEHAKVRPKKPLRPSTAKEYRRYMDGVLLERFGSWKIGAIEAEDIEALISELHRKGLSESTISNHLRPLAGALRFAVRTKRLLPVSPMDLIGEDYRVSSMAQREHREWSDADIQKVVDGARANDAGKDARRAYALAIELMFACGLRLGEMLATRVGNIDFEKGNLQVSHSWGKDNTLGPLKTKTSERIVPIPTDLLSRLATASLDLDAGDFVFAWARGSNPPSQTNFRRRAWNPAIEKAGLGDGPKTTPHDARHAFASQLAARGVSSNDLRDTLGHSTTKVTEGTYVHAFGREERLERIRQAQEPLAA